MTPPNLCPIEKSNNAARCHHITWGPYATAHRLRCHHCLPEIIGMANVAYLRHAHTTKRTQWDQPSNQINNSWQTRQNHSSTNATDLSHCKNHRHWSHHKWVDVQHHQPSSKYGEHNQNQNHDKTRPTWIGETGERLPYQRPGRNQSLHPPPPWNMIPTPTLL